MNYPEFHSHKWAKTFAKAKTLLEQANALYQQGQVDEAKLSLDKLYNGDFTNENDIFPVYLLNRFRTYANCRCF